MMRFISRLRNIKDAPSVTWHTSQADPGVRFAIRRVSLQQRIELNRRLRDLTLDHEFLTAGDATNQLDAALSELLVAKLYIEWGLIAIEGLSIDGQKATPALLVSNGPENLTDEVVQRIQAEITLTEDERKNF